MAQALRDEPGGGVELLACHQLTPELAERLAGVDVVVFADAATAQEPGSVVVTELQPGAEPTALAHSADPQALLGLARALYGRAPRAWLVAIGATRSRWGTVCRRSSPRPCRGRWLRRAT